MAQHHFGSLLVKIVEMCNFSDTRIILRELLVKLLIGFLALVEALLELAALKIKSLEQGSEGIPSIIPLLR